MLNFPMDICLKTFKLKTEKYMIKKQLIFFS